MLTISGRKFQYNIYVCNVSCLYEDHMVLSEAMNKHITLIIRQSIAQCAI